MKKKRREKKMEGVKKGGRIYQSCASSHATSRVPKGRLTGRSAHRREKGGGGSVIGEGKRGGGGEIKTSVSGESSEQEEMKRGNKKKTSYLSKRG
jgi:hypothetical protein